ncbi:tryptophan-rich sensory protein [Ruminococcus sp. AF41-9]|nr:tryptophan-rich sensory protein [Ruminococcus sp. AF41-9]
MKRPPLLVSLLISLGTGVIAGFLTFGSMAQYQEMYHPPLAPPGWVFPVVWLLLYTLMGIASYRIYLKNPKAEVLKLYLIQLAVNFFWPVFFFNLGWQLFAAVWLLVLWYLVFVMIKEFARIDEGAARLMIPYLVWLTFAAYLNIVIALHR